MGALISLLAVLVLAAIAYVGVDAVHAHSAFGILIPYFAIVVFVFGIVYRVVKWARAPVPFRIPTTCGQQRSLPWIKSETLETPHTTLGVIGRMALEVLFFRSLFRNTSCEVTGERRLVFGSSKWLWAGALVFHWSFLIIFLRHFRFFLEPVPFFITGIETFDGLFQIGLPVFYLTDIAILAALSYLFVRRVVVPQVRYISLASDYFALFLLLGIVLSGVLMRYFALFRVDVTAVKELAMGLFVFSPAAAETMTAIGSTFYVHLFLICMLLVYFPFSKLLHMPGVFMSPTRNLANNNREVRHVNPWDAPVKVHTYEEWEDEFRDKIRGTSLPLDKE